MGAGSAAMAVSVEKGMQGTGHLGVHYEIRNSGAGVQLCGAWIYMPCPLQSYLGASTNAKWEQPTPGRQRNGLAYATGCVGK